MGYHCDAARAGEFVCWTDSGSMSTWSGRGPNVPWNRIILVRILHKEGVVSQVGALIS